MAVAPFARKRLIRPGSNDPRIKARVVIWHVAVSMTESLHAYFNGPSGGIESHFYINWRGKIEQYRDTAFQADANYRANDFAISVETAGWANGRWNPLQRRGMKRLSLWLEATEGIPLKRCDGPYGSGHGYHTMWGAPSAWTPVAKSCPGPGRIKQFNGWFTRWLNSNPALPKPQPDTSEDDMASILDEPLNQHDPKGNDVTASVTVREALSAFVHYIFGGRRAARRYLRRAQDSKAPR